MVENLKKKQKISVAMQLFGVSLVNRAYAPSGRRNEGEPFLQPAPDPKAKKMSLVDKFDNKNETGYVRRFDRESARRQFRVSLLLIVAMALSAFVLGFAMPVGTPNTTTGAAVDPTVFSGRLVTFDR